MVFGSICVCFPAILEGMVCIAQSLGLLILPPPFCTHKTTKNPGYVIPTNDSYAEKKKEMLGCPR